MPVAATKTKETFEHLVEDATFTVLLVFSAFVSLALILVLVFGETGWFAPVAALLRSLRLYVFPWLIALAILSIAREVWMIRVYSSYTALSEALKRRN